MGRSILSLHYILLVILRGNSGTCPLELTCIFLDIYITIHLHISRDLDVTHTVGINKMFPYHLKKKESWLSYGVLTFFKPYVYCFFTITVVHIHSFYSVYTLTISTRHFLSNFAQIHHEKSRNKRRTRAKLARREAINRREEKKQSTD